MELPAVKSGSVVVDDELEADILGFHGGKVRMGGAMSSEARPLLIDRKSA